MTISRSLYTTGLALATAAFSVVPPDWGKLSRAVRGMRGASERLSAWAARHRDPARPLVWFHAPSVGEGLQARSVIEALTDLRPDVQIVYTYFSPSAEPFAARVAADVTDYLPPDLPWSVARVLDALRPQAIVFSKTEVWPNLVLSAARYGIPTLLLSATLPPSSSRLRLPARTLLREAHAHLTLVGAISGDDAERFGLLSVPAYRRRVMGDARFDQVWLRTRRPEGNATLSDLRDSSAAPVLVAGSTWPPDEERLLEALAAFRNASIPLRAIIAPHEPTERTLSRLANELGSRRIPFRRLSESPSGEAPDGVIVVDRVGVLGDLYALADLAYVGGGFGRAGLHSVLEPAAFGVPVLFGPHHRNAREADELIRAGAAIEVGDAATLERRIHDWIIDADARRRAGAAAAHYVMTGRGAAERGARMILDLIPASIDG